MAAGWNEKEFSFLGADYHNRGKKLDESIVLLRSLWRGEKEFHGKALAVNFDSGVFEPIPVNPHIPIWIGGTSEAAMNRAVELGDAWHPNVVPMESFKRLVGQFRKVSSRAREKDICVRIGLNTAAKESEYVGPQGDRRVLFSGNMAENREMVSELQKLGVSTAVLVPSPDGKVTTEAQIYSIREFAREFLKAA